ncbi:glycosyltransferase family 2 protein [Paracoccus aestuariivivens]|uniref:Uncharacterized protein n=1 Tax=Paracoccus aestuariivivens TaxID=1820333 RepID=A0A6L6JGB5_9RHOB|nr:glycosyltransferase family 2 protein [Paracoccus aestuariivivens]MTH80238.1 hypothetical protein [Paracoccus aestuariivivens]
MLDYNIKDVSEFWCSIDWSISSEAEIVLKSVEGVLGSLKVSLADGVVALNILNEDAVSGIGSSALPVNHSSSHLAIELIRDDSGRFHAIDLKLDGQPAAMVDLTRLAELPQLESLTCRGAVIPVSCGMWPISASISSENANLYLGNYLTLRGFIKTTDTDKLDAILLVEEQGQSIPLTAALDDSDPQTDASSWSIEVPLPGWIWEGSEDSVTICLRSHGNDLARLVIGKADILQRIETIAAEIDPERDASNSLSLVEHVVYGEFRSSLSLTASLFLERAASTYGVQDFVATSTEPAPTLAKKSNHASKAPKIGSVAVTKAVELGAATVNSDPTDIPPALDRIVKSFSLDNRQRCDFYLQLTETFVLSQKFDKLWESASRNADIPSLPNGDNWMQSVTLPYLAHTRRYREVADILWGLNPESGWLVTPGIAYATRWLVSQDAPNGEAEETLRRILYGYMHLVRQLKASYWGRAQCSELIRTSAYLVASGRRFPTHVRDDIETFALECHGLSSEFWRHIDGISEGSGAAIRRASAHFGRIEAYADAKIEDRAPLKEDLLNALRYFFKHNHQDAVRFLLELLPCDEQLQCITGDIAGMQLGREPALQELVRVVAHPLFSGDGAEHVSELRRALKICGADVPQVAPRDAVIDAVASLRDFEQARLLGGQSGNVDLLSVERQITALNRVGAQSKALELALLLVGMMIRLGDDEGVIRACAKANSIMTAHGAQTSTAGIQSALRALKATGPKWQPLVSDLLQRISGPAETRLAPTKADPLTDVGHGQASQVFDTIVTIITCRKYIDERGPAIMDSWARKLQHLGIPYVFVTGGDEDKLTGDLLQLGCPDDYEHLPEKVLATIRWVHEHTNFSFMLKIDDDCFLNVDEFFLEHSYRNHDYYGRTIYRPIGGMDRMWHMQKSTSHRARKELDKSPEPSLYADGGSGYTLSRVAMTEILGQLETSFGVMLKNSSYMEDKLVGDLLQLSGISIASEGYNVAVLRKLPLSDRSIGMFSNSFLPSRVWPVKLAHLDKPEMFAKAVEQSDAYTLRPSKIWPTFAPPLTGANTNALELVSDHAGVPALLRHDHAVVACVRNERHIMPAFLDHYRKLGVKSFLISDNCSTDGTLTYLLEQPDVVCFACDTEYKKSTFGVAWQQALLAGFRTGLWSIVVDADELLVFPGYKNRPIAEFLDEQGAKGHDAICSLMLDMYPKGPLSEFDISRDDPFKVAGYVDKEPLRSVWFHGPYSNSPTWTSSLRHRLAPHSSVNSFTSQKTCILKYKPWMQLSAGLHYVGDAKISPELALLCHFKYHSGFHKKVLDEINRNQHFDDSAEYRAYADALESGFNGFYDDENSTHWSEAKIIRDDLSSVPDLVPGPVQKKIRK